MALHIFRPILFDTKPTNLLRCHEILLICYESLRRVVKAVSAIYFAGKSTQILFAPHNCPRKHPKSEKGLAPYEGITSPSPEFRTSGELEGHESDSAPDDEDLRLHVVANTAEKSDIHVNIVGYVDKLKDNQNLRETRREEQPIHRTVYCSSRSKTYERIF